MVGGAPGRGGLPPLRGASGVRRCPSPSCPPSGAGSRGSATRVSQVRSVRAWGPSTGPTAGALAGRRRSPWGWRKGPLGGAFHCCEGRLMSGAPPSPDCMPSERAVGVRHPLLLWARVCGCGGPAQSPRLACLVGAALRGRWLGPSPGTRPATVARGGWCQALSLPRSPALWAGRRGPPPTCCGRGRAGVGARHCPLGLHAL